MARLKDGAGKAVSAGEFFPMAARHGLTSELDRKLLMLLLDGLDVSAVPSGGIAFNVSIHSLYDEGFRAWLFQTLRQHPAAAAGIVFELAEFGIEMHEAEVRSFVAGLRAARGRFAIDHFGLSKGALRYLHLFRPDYVKLSGSYSKGLAEDQGNQFFITSLVRISRLLGIRIISQAVEDAQTRDLLRELGVDAYQGYLAGKPIPFRG
jgi:EAL domain-containing protein (putative c-di-GMP-specific phosphodiesterase class I)